MNKIIFVLITFSQSLCFSCPHTDAIKTFIRGKIDTFMFKNGIAHMTKEEVATLEAYLEVLDYVASID